ncbi:MAG: hypothetical protein AAGF95_06350 [Chloroflexota bacterium]
MLYPTVLRALWIHARSCTNGGTNRDGSSAQRRTDYHIKHELIHHWQAQKLGLIGLMQSPIWIHGGMACALSDDPRRPLTGPLGDLPNTIRGMVYQSNW